MPGIAFFCLRRDTRSPRAALTQPRSLSGNGKAFFHWRLPDEKVVIIDGDVTTCAN